MHLCQVTKLPCLDLPLPFTFLLPEVRRSWMMVPHVSPAKDRSTLIRLCRAKKLSCATVVKRILYGYAGRSFPDDYLSPVRPRESGCPSLSAARQVAAPQL